MIGPLLLALFLLLGFGLVCSTIVGLPGGWILLCAAISLELLDGSIGVGPITFGWGIIAIASTIQITSEGLEFLAGSIGAKWGGASKRGMFAALVGGIVGTIVGTFTIPIPLFGSLLGSVMGSFGGAYLIEKKELENSKALKSATGAALGRTAGALSKIGLSFVMFVLLSISMGYNYLF